MNTMTRTRPSKWQTAERLLPLIIGALMAFVVIAGVAYGVHQLNQAVAQFHVLTDGTQP